MIYFTADPHFGHDNIIEFCSRPFSSAQEMDEIIIQRCNEVASENDDLYVLGDVTMGNYRTAMGYLHQLHSNVFVVPGGHDHRWVREFKRECSDWFFSDIAVVYKPNDTIITVLPPLYSLEINASLWASATKEKHGPAYFESRLTRGGRSLVIVMCHYAMRVWDRSHYGAWHLYGHSHGRLPPSEELSMDVGVDTHDFRPYSLDEVYAHMRRLAAQKAGGP